VLTNEDAIFAYYGPLTRSELSGYTLHNPGEFYLSLRDKKVFIYPIVKQLARMSRANRELRKEVRSYFFANNSFRIGGSKRTSFSTSLDDIGGDGRADITKPDLDGNGFWVYNGSFFSLLGACVNLRHFKIRMHLSHILDEETYDMIHTYIHLDKKAWVDRGEPVVVSDLVNVFNLLPALQTLEVKPTFPKRGCIAGRAQRLEVAEAKIKVPVTRKLEDVFEGKDIKITVKMFTGGPKLQRETKEGWRTEYRIGNGTHYPRSQLKARTYVPGAMSSCCGGAFGFKRLTYISLNSSHTSPIQSCLLLRDFNADTGLKMVTMMRSAMWTIADKNHAVLCCQQDRCSLTWMLTVIISTLFIRCT
jgi:hypothetical protein